MVRQRACRHHFHHRADTGGRRPGDGAPTTAVELHRRVGTNVFVAREASLFLSLDRGVHKYHVLIDRRQGIAQQFVGQVALVAKIKFVQQEPHEFTVAGVTHGFVVEFLHLAKVGFTHRPQPTRGGERLQHEAVNQDNLQAFKRRYHLRVPVADHFAIVDVFVDHALGGPVEGIAELAARMLGQGTDAQLDRTQHIEMTREMRADDTDESGSQSALRGHDAFRGACHFKDCLGRGNVLGQIEIVHGRIMRNARNVHIQVEWQTGNHRILSGQRCFQSKRIGDVLGSHFKWQTRRGIGINAGHHKSRASQQGSDQASYLAESEYRNIFQFGSHLFVS